jgi:hypothetical protein
MSILPIKVCELAAWGFDNYPYRPAHVQTVNRGVLVFRPEFVQPTVVAATEWDGLRTSLQSELGRADLLREMGGLEWSLDVICLRNLVSFQRRLSFDPAREPRSLPASRTEDELLAWSFDVSQTPVFESRMEDQRTLVVRSRNPNVQISLSGATACATVTTGSPFVEVAEYRGRWFLRDGYHRCYQLLQQGLDTVPAVIVRARSLEELGAASPKFFSEEVLFSERPPMVVDFLDEDLTVTYFRHRLVKVIRATVEEHYEPETQSGDLI